MLCRFPPAKDLPALSLMLDDIGGPAPAALALALGAPVATVRRWITADIAPRPVMLALWSLTRWGMSKEACDAFNEAQVQRGLAQGWQREAEAMRAELARVLAAGDFGCANDPSLAGRPAVPAPRPVLQLVRA